MTDLFALAILPIAFYYRPIYNYTIQLNPIPIALISLFSFFATTVPTPSQVFEQPQYLLFKSGVTDLQSASYPNEYEVYDLDSLFVVGIEQIRIDKFPAINDEFHKVQILKELELRLLRESRYGERSQKELVDFEALRESLTVKGRTSIGLKQDAYTDSLNFNGTRLDGHFNRFSNDNNLINLL